VAFNPDKIYKWLDTRKNKKQIEKFVKLEMRKARILGIKRQIDKSK
jgi:hypothetical protein